MSRRLGLGLVVSVASLAMMTGPGATSAARNASWKRSSSPPALSPLSARFQKRGDCHKRPVSAWQMVVTDTPVDTREVGELRLRQLGAAAGRVASAS